MKIYLIFDRRTGLFWKNGAKGAWITKAAAKNAIMCKFGCSRENWKNKFDQTEVCEHWKVSENWDDRYLSFDKQFRFQCREYDIDKFDFKDVSL